MVERASDNAELPNGHFLDHYPPIHRHDRGVCGGLCARAETAVAVMQPLAASLSQLRRAELRRVTTLLYGYVRLSPYSQALAKGCRIAEDGGCCLSANNQNFVWRREMGGARAHQASVINKMRFHIPEQSTTLDVLIS